MLNGQRYQTRASSITLKLDQPVNQLEVRTDLECQGVYSQSITLTEAPIALPNPIDSGDLTVFVPAAGWLPDWHADAFNERQQPIEQGSGY